MNSTSLDLSQQNDLRWLNTLVAAVRVGAAGIPFFLTGATARDLLLWYGHKIHTGRATRDVDVAFAIAGWDDFSALTARLVASGVFSEVPHVPGRLRFQGTLDVDLLPFGGVEDGNRSIAWPPDGETVLNVFALQEVLTDAVEVQLPGGELVRVPSLAGLGLLKIVAWTDRRLTAPGKDAADFALILRDYLRAGNEERVWEEGAHLLDEGGFDYEAAGGWLLGHDMATLLDRDGQLWLSALLEREADPEGPLRLIGDMRIDPLITLPLVQSTARGVRETIEGGKGSGTPE
jgi:predicted nucleotidyltransferase